MVVAERRGLRLKHPGSGWLQEKDTSFNRDCNKKVLGSLRGLTQGASELRSGLDSRIQAVVIRRVCEEREVGVPDLLGLVYPLAALTGVPLLAPHVDVVLPEAAVLATGERYGLDTLPHLKVGDSPHGRLVPEPEGEDIPGSVHVSVVRRAAIRAHPGSLIQTRAAFRPSNASAS